MKNIGLKKGTVEVVAYQDSWRINFQKEKELIDSLCNKYIKDVEHVGSTAIKGMPAKPIIDIIVGIDAYHNVSKVKKGLAGLGYDFRLEPRRYQSLFVKMNGDKEACYLKVLRYKGSWWRGYVSFRNKLSSDKRFFESYKRLKLKLARNYFNNRKSYTKGKAALIKRILSEIA